MNRSFKFTFNSINTTPWCVHSNLFEFLIVANV